MSKRFLVCLLVGLSGTAFAEPTSFKGMFVGLGGGYSFGDFKNIATFLDENGSPEPSAVNTKTSLSGATGELAVGYGYVFPNCIYLGGDIFGGLTSLKGENAFKAHYSNFPSGTPAILNSTTSLKMTGFYGARLRPGFLFGKRTVLHGTIGVTSAQWKGKALKDETIINTMPDANCKKWRAGFTFGAGMMTKVTDRMSVGLEFTHTTYKSLAMKQILDPADPKPEFIQYTLKPRVNQIMLKFAYHFGKKGAASAPVAT